MRSVAAEAEVYLWLGAADTRAGFERLAALVQERMSRTVMSGGLYVFVSRCRRRVKILYWDRDGYALWYKRLEAGTFRIESREGLKGRIQEARVFRLSVRGPGRTVESQRSATLATQNHRAARYIS